MCLLVDGTTVLLHGITSTMVLVALVATIAVDAALSGPARLSGVVAIAHAAVAVGTAIFVWSGPANDAGILIAGYRAGAWLSGFPALMSLAVLAAGGAATHLLNSGKPAFAAIVAGKVALLPWLVGRYTTARRAYLAEMERRSELDRRDAKEAVFAAVTAERSAIARDLHDVIIHHVSAIGLHAGAARLGLDSGNARLEKSLRSVEAASRAAMVDLRHLLDLLHGDQTEGARQPGLGNLDELFDGVRAAGVPAQLRVSGAPRDVSESLDITLYRIVQEMLTNALRHGDLSRVEVTLGYTPTMLSLTAINPVGITRAPGNTPRRGLVGIRNRAGMFDGRTVSGLQADGKTWRTVVTFPLEVAQVETAQVETAQ